MSATLIEALDALENQVASLSAAVKTADPRKIGQTAAQSAQDGARRGVEASGVVRASEKLTGASEALLEALYTSQARERRLRLWKPPVLVLGLLLAGMVGGLFLSTTEVGCLLSFGDHRADSSSGWTWCGHGGW